MRQSPEARRVQALKRQLQGTVREMVGRVAPLTAAERPRGRLQLDNDVTAALMDELQPLREQAVREQVDEDEAREQSQAEDGE